MIKFFIKESFKSISRAKTSFFLSFISMSIAVVLILFAISMYTLSKELRSNFSKKIVLNVFLQDSVSANDQNNLEIAMANINCIMGYRYINKDEAAKNFIAETGEDFKKILDYNPLPSSYIVNLNEECLDKKNIDDVIKEIDRMNGVDEVVYQSRLTEKIITSLNTFNKYIIGISVLFLLISIYIVFSTIKLILNNKFEELETMKLVGAKLFIIKGPIIINGFIIGVLSSIFAYFLFIAAINFLPFEITFIPELIFKNKLNLALLFFAGPFIGTTVSIIALKKLNYKV